MATLVLTAVGTIIGGPIGGAVGGLIGKQVDQSVFGRGSREGPRLKELAITTSSYGQPIPRVFGRMRVGGSVIWSTELNENSSTEGSKGQPSTTTYSYSASFAVAVSSSPINRVGRIWADGKLLRGANEDLKVEGEMRTYKGNGNEPIDPLISADKGANATAFRDCAYVVFDNLELADFGNRIPALTFEVFSSDDTQVSLNDLVPNISTDGENTAIGELRGFSDEGGSLAASLSAIDRVMPLTCKVHESGLKISTGTVSTADAPTLPQQLSPRASEEANERHKQRGQQAEREPLAVRYYDEERDYQPGVQRANGVRADGRELMIDLPATMTADGAKKLANANAQLSRWQKEQTVWRIGQLDPSIQPGSVVRIPDFAGFWRVNSWEWYDQGIELALERIAPEAGSIPNSDPGTSNSALDLEAPSTNIQFFEAPADSTQSRTTPLMYAAASAENAGWNGAALFAETTSGLEPIGSSGPLRAFTGTLVQALPASTSLFFEPEAQVLLASSAPDLELTHSSLAGIANGANRLLIGGEVVQFADAVEMSPGEWLLSGLLRGRGGTEDAATAGHSAGTQITYLNDRIVSIDYEKLPSDGTARIAAIGRGDIEPVYANLQNAGLSRRPPPPVHPRAKHWANGDREWCWTRRARGHWRWDSLFEVPLVEDQELYLVGYGPTNAPAQSWFVNETRFNLTGSDIADLVSQHGAGELWVRQVGTLAQSPALLLTILN